MMPPPIPPACLLLESLHSKIVRGYTQFLQGFSLQLCWQWEFYLQVFLFY